MIDIDSIGKRIKEERKYIMKVSQEKMAEDLNMYQADISNMEKAKSGSGITDLIKLDLIADYFNIPLDTLLFGREDKNMLKYHGEKMKLKVSKKKMTKAHKQKLLKLTGYKDEEEINVLTHECGPYTIYTLVEQQMTWGESSEIVDGKLINPDFTLLKFHTYIFFGVELIGVMVADYTTAMQHVHRPSLQKLQTLIQGDVLDVTDVWRTLNPYWALWSFTEDSPEKDEYFDKMYKRMDEIRQLGENRPILYIENVYVREDSRKNGIFRLYIDLLKMIFDGCIIWLNMEPTSGNEVDQEYDCVPFYSVSELGQLSMNAFIAERVGFTVDPDAWNRLVETIDENGDASVEEVLIRKCAYYLPGPIRKMLENDGKLVMQGRAKQKVAELAMDEQSGGTIDVNHGYKGDDFVSEVRITMPRGKFYYATALVKPDGCKRYVVSYSSFLRDSKEWIVEEYSSLEEAQESEYFDTIQMAEELLMFGNVTPDSVMMEEANALDEEVENFDILNDISFTISDQDKNILIEILEVKLRRSNTESAGEILYAIVLLNKDGNAHYALNHYSIADIKAEIPAILNHYSISDIKTGFTVILNQLDPVVEFEEAELMHSKYNRMFHLIRSKMDLEQQS